MKTSIRTHIIFVALILAATFGVGQIWSLAQALRIGTAGMSDVVIGASGMMLLVASSLILGRLFYVLARMQKMQTQKQEVYDETQNHDI